MAEKSLWSYLRKGMKGKWRHAKRHEDLLGGGTSDVSYYHHGNSWIELKEVKKLPARETTGINLGQYHKEESQRHFLIMRKGWLLIRVNYPKRTYILFDWNDLPPYDKPHWTYDEMMEHCIIYWWRRINFDEMDHILRHPE